MQAGSREPNVKWLFFSPSGRAGRQTFILGWLFWTMINSYAVTKLAMAHEDDEFLALWSLLFFASLALSIVSAVMLSIKRLHDMGLPGLMATLMFIPAISLVMLFVLCIWPSNTGANQHGPAPDWPGA